MRSMIAVKREMARLAKRTDGDQSQGWKREESLRLWALLWATGWSDGDCDDFIQNARAPMNADDDDMDDWQPSKRDEAHAAACEGYPDTWQHCIIHLNPATGEMHSDGDHRVRLWIKDRLLPNIDITNTPEHPTKTLRG